MKQEIKLTVDTLVKTERAGVANILLIQRKNEPYEGKWALPGGFVENDEDLEDAAKRELNEETNIEVNEIKQLAAFGNPDRDPRGRIVTVAFLAEVPFQLAKSSSDAAKADWFPLDGLPPLAFDHDQIIERAKFHWRENDGIQY